MPRIARQKHDNAVYHVSVRGNNRERIFFNDEDKIRFFETLIRYKEKYQMTIYAYCIMDNHFHLLINSNGQDISKIMQGINLSYTLYVNRRYERCGHLFQGRFKSIIAKGDKDIIQESKYIHRNPVKAGIVKNVSEYKWSSFDVYAGKKDVYNIIDEEFVLRYYSEEKSKAREMYIEFVNDEKEEIKSEIEEDIYVSSDKKVVIEKIDVKEIISKVAKYYNICAEDVTLRGNKRNARAKQIAAYLISLKGRLQYQEIGEIFDICASAVGHNIRKATEYIVGNREQASELGLIF